jgi:hypothetical protein
VIDIRMSGSHTARKGVFKALKHEITVNNMQTCRPYLKGTPLACYKNNWGKMQKLVTLKYVVPIVTACFKRINVVVY